MEKRLVLFMFLSALIMFGYIFVSDMTATNGQVDIQSADPSLEVGIKYRDGESVTNIQLTEGHARTLFPAGEYEIVITGENADQFDIEPNIFTLEPNHRQTVMIQRKPPDEHVASVDPSTDVENPKDPSGKPLTPNEVTLEQADVERVTPRRRLTLGSAEHGSPVPFLVTFDSRGGAIERIELTERTKNNGFRYRNLEDDSGYLGYLSLVNDRKLGCVVNVVGPGTPADVATSVNSPGEPGLKVGDVIEQFNGNEIKSVAEFERAQSQTRPGETVDLSVRRMIDGQSTSMQFTTVLMERPFVLIQAEVNSRAGALTPDPLSLLMSIHNIGGKEGKTVALGQNELADLKSLHSSNWVAIEIDSPYPGVEFSLTLTQADLEKIGLKGSWEFIKRFTLTPLANPTKNDRMLNYHLQLEIELKNKGSEAQQIAYRIDGPNGLSTEGWWYSRKIHPKMFRGAGARDVVWKSRAEGYRLLGCPKIMADAVKAEKSGRPIVTSILSQNDQEERRKLYNIGVDTQYFAAALIPGTLDGLEARRGNNQEPNSLTINEAIATPLGSSTRLPKKLYRLGNVSFQIVSEPKLVQPEESLKQEFVVFTGPKHPEVLRQYALDDYIEYGWTIVAVFARPLWWLLDQFYLFVGNYGIAIIMLTVLVRACMIPISLKAAKNAQKMQELAPELKQISEKYKGDMEKTRQAQQEVYRKHNFNPFGSCLLMFLQLPVFIGLYRCLSIDIELRQAALIPGLQWCSNLAGPDMLFRWDAFLFEFIAGEGTGWLGPYFNVLPLITVALFLVQQKLFTPPPTDEQTRMQHQMMKYMMLFMGVLFFTVPSGLCVYFIATSCWSVAERKLIGKKKTDDETTPEKPALPVKKKAASQASGNGAAKKARQRKKQKRR